MSTVLAIVLIGFSTAIIIILIVLMGRVPKAAQPDPAPRFDNLEKGQERMERSFRDEIAKNREESGANSRQAREELGKAFHDFRESTLSRMTDMINIQKGQLDTFSERLNTLTQTNEQKLEKMRETVECRLNDLREDNTKKLEQMRLTVDEKLHDTLEKRLGESFKLVSERLEQVHKGLGEMQTLAMGVGDLKKVLSNVKTRGTFGEIQLSGLLEQLLAPDQYEKNVATKKGSSARVEFAIKLPGKDETQGNAVWLPIDAKFPQEDYQRLVEAQEQGDAAKVEDSSKQLDRVVRDMAKNIRDKYLDPPNTTDFGIMFLPTEGLYAEVLRRPGLFEQLQRDFRVTLTGPTTLAALLNSLQMGFRTLAIERRSSEVWALLGAVKTEFARFGEVLDKTKKKLEEATNTIDTASVRSRAIERKLRGVQVLPSTEAARLLGSAEEGGGAEEA